MGLLQPHGPQIPRCRPSPRVCHDGPMGARGRVVVVGQGYVGLPLAMRAVEVGYVVVGYELDARRAERLAAGDSYVGDIPSKRLAAALASGQYRPTSDAAELAGFDVAVISVPTP